jgi:1-deoxy-D-xylulose-5-phosphate synthase
MAPSDEAELNRCLRLAISLESASALRYPRDNVPASNFEEVIDPSLRDDAKQEWVVGKSRVLCDGSDATIIAYGALAQNAMLAAEQCSVDGLDVEVIDARFCKPVDGEMLQRVLGRTGHAVLTLEDHSLQNGFGSAVLEYASAHGLAVENVTRLGMPDRLIPHASRPQQLAEVGLDAAGIAASVKDAIRRAKGQSAVVRAVQATL